MNSRFFRLRVALISAAVVSGSWGCGGQSSSGGDTNTNWLKSCDQDAECGTAYSCMCGRCTIACAEDLDCDGQPREAVCRSAPGSCDSRVNSCREPTGQATNPTDAGADDIQTDAAVVDTVRNEVEASAGADCATESTLCTQPPEIVSFEASESVLPGGGGSIELTWTVRRAQTLTLRSDQTAEEVPLSGETFSVTPTRTTTYTLVATNVIEAVQSSISIRVTARGLRDWTQQAEDDTSEARGTALGNDGSLVIAGLVQAGEQDQPNAFVASYSVDDGELVWGEELGDAGSDWANSVATDLEGSSFVVGLTEGLAETDTSGAADAFVAKYSASGERLWIQLLGQAERDEAMGVTVDATGAVLVTGQFGSADAGPRAFLAKFSNAGEQLWVQELGAGDAGGTIAKGVAAAADGQSVTIVGSTDESLEGDEFGLADAFFARYSSDGDLMLVRQFGTPEGDDAEGVSLDAEGNIFVVGESYAGLGGLALGGADVYLARFTPSGEVTWMLPLGTERQDLAFDVALDPDANIYVTGVTEGALAGENLGRYDVFVAKLSAEGETLWSEQFGTDQQDYGYGVVADPEGNVFVTGATSGDLEGERSGGSRWFVTRFR